ncbi:MAG: hypothetical protein IPM53_21755 [Anaerolineaceae bacterium]|nr:hypothetical protein [Anaerolineaceae bacterium]
MARLLVVGNGLVVEGRLYAIGKNGEMGNGRIGLGEGGGIRPFPHING